MGQARFHNRAWLCRTNGTWSVDDGRPKGLPYLKWESILDFRRGGACPSRKAFPFRGRWLAEGQTDEVSRILARYRWFGKPRRGGGIAPVLIFANPGPSGPG